MTQDERYGREYGTVPEYADNVTVSENRDNVIAGGGKSIGKTAALEAEITRVLNENADVMGYDGEDEVP